MSEKPRTIPNPESKLLKTAIIGGAGLTPPPVLEPPEGMGAIVLYVPLSQLMAMNALDIQSDLGLPWSVEGGGGAWFDSLC